MIPANSPSFPALYLYPLNDTWHPRHIFLTNQRTKIGRGQTSETTPGERNVFFDSKVLSRQHAEVWEEGNKIYIRDVKSSNGTFINGERLSNEGYESEPFELKSDDIVEFGIDIDDKDNKGVVFHKVTARVVCVFSEHEVQAVARAEAHQQQQQNMQQADALMIPAKNPPFPVLYLYPLDDTWHPRHIFLTNKRAIIGRDTGPKTASEERNGFFQSKVVSEQHAVVWEEGSKIYIRDMGSSNGTFINGERISNNGRRSEPFELKSDDIVEFGIDIVGEDNKTIHPKVAARVICVTSEHDVQAAARAEAYYEQQLQEALRQQQLPFLQTQSFHSTILPDLQVSVYDALTTFEPGISPWMHPAEWLGANTKHIRAIFDGIVGDTTNKTITFPAAMLFQRLIVYMLAYSLRSSDESLSDELNATLKKYQDRDIINQMRSQVNIKNGLSIIFRNASPAHREMQFEDLLKKLIVLDSVALSANVEVLIADEETYEELIETTGPGAQALVNLLHARLDFPMDSGHKRLLADALTRLSERSGFYPESLTLNNVTPERGRRATGGFADVYKGRCLGADIALKVFKISLPSGVDSLNSWRSSDDRFQSLIREVITWRQLSHPNVLPFYGVHFLEEPLEIRFCLVSPWMENGNVVEFLARQNRVGPYTATANCVYLALDIAYGIQYLHSENVIHRDLKGYNILISPSTRACIADFGLATFTDSGSAATLVGSAIMGTPKWLAPELIPHAQVKRHHTYASDIYAFALVCYEMFSGKVPFEDVDVYHLKPCLERGERPALPADDLSRRRGLSVEMEDLIRDCWTQDPTTRPSADKVVKRLQVLSLADVDERPLNESGTSFFTQLLSDQVDNPFAILSKEYPEA